MTVLTLRTPPLREVRGDLPLLVRHFVAKICERQGLPPANRQPGSDGRAHHGPRGPGNVRQLVHELERALLRCSGGDVQPSHLSSEFLQFAVGSEGFVETRERMIEAWEGEQIRAGLERTDWNVSRLSKDLGISRRWLMAKISRLGLRRQKPRGEP